MVMVLIYFRVYIVSDDPTGLACTDKVAKVPGVQ
jgi:hypothetical protein